MAKPSKQRPWVVEVYVPAFNKWFDLDAYRDKQEAEMQMALKRKRDPRTEFRVTEWRDQRGRG